MPYMLFCSSPLDILDAANKLSKQIFAESLRML